MTAMGFPRTYYSIVASQSEVVFPCADDFLYINYPACELASAPIPPGPSPNDSCTDHAPVYSVVVDRPCLNYSIRLSGPGGMNGALADVEPDKVVSGLRAEVTCDGKPSDKAVLLTVAADAKTGGHQHHDSARPPGALSPASGNSPVAFSFTAPAVSGDHTVTAHCLDNTCGEDKGKVWVGIKGLVSMAPSIDYALVGGVGTTHPDNHYLTPTADAKAKWLAILYRFNFPANPILHLNDASLERGGLFDITPVPWVIDHLTHRLGKEIDIRANPLINPATSIPEADFKKFEVMALKAGATFCGKGKDNIAYRGSVIQHYHTCLNGGHCCSGGN